MDSLFKFVEPIGFILVVLIFSILPLWGFLIRMREDPLTRLLFSSAGSFLLIYLLGFFSYLLKFDIVISFWILIGICLISLFFGLFFNCEHKSDSKIFELGIFTWLSLAVWIIALQILVVVYGAVYWTGDWYEHYERSIFYLDQLPPKTRFLNGLWTLPARGPLFNVNAGLLMAGLGRDFWVYQSISTVFNTFPLIAFALLIRDFGAVQQKTALILAGIIFGLSLFAVRNEVYSWNKFFTMGFILGGIYLYRRGLFENQPSKVGWSFIFFSLGILAHYLTVGIGLFFVGHYLIRIWPKKIPLSKVAIPLSISIIVLSTWFVFCFSIFGVKRTLNANSTIGDDFVKMRAQQTEYSITWPRIFVGNLITTLVPYSFRHDWEGWVKSPRMKLGNYHFETKPNLQKETDFFQYEWLYDQVNNRSSILGALGLVGSFCVFGALLARVRKGIKFDFLQTFIGKEEIGGMFWWIFFGIGIPFNIFFVRDFLITGVAHLNLHSFIYLAVAMSFIWLKHLKLWIRWLVSFIFVLESSVSIFALVQLLGRHVRVVKSVGGEFLQIPPMGLNIAYVNNHNVKIVQELSFLYDRAGDLALNISVSLMFGVLVFNYLLWKFFFTKK